MAISIEVKTILIDGGCLWRDHNEYYAKFVRSLSYMKLADLVATICYSSKSLGCEQVLEEIDVYGRLILSLDLLKKDMEIHEIRQFNAKEIEDRRISHYGVLSLRISKRRLQGMKIQHWTLLQMWFVIQLFQFLTRIKSHLMFCKLLNEKKKTYHICYKVQPSSIISAITLRG
ncbi:lon protease homolog, mitochondrial-like [Rutidosis leptorrhynchoides]|uniref:lon protease homolog, mitochondrial-like n=1 Tax=Rutidosis leptorrhynchoides TaxID=125765 RepID=UPI003A99D6C5